MSKHNPLMDVKPSSNNYNPHNEINQLLIVRVLSQLTGSGGEENRLIYMLRDLG